MVEKVSSDERRRRVYLFISVGLEDFTALLNRKETFSTMLRIHMSGVDHDVEVPIEDSTFKVGALKTLLESRTGVSSVRQKVLFNTEQGRACILRDNQVLSDAGVKHNSRINIVVLPANEASQSRQLELQRNLQESGIWTRAERQSAIETFHTVQEVPETAKAQSHRGKEAVDTEDSNALLVHASRALDRFDSCLNNPTTRGANSDAVDGSRQGRGLNSVSLEKLLRRHFAALHSLQMPMLELAEECRTAKMNEAASAMVAAANTNSARAQSLEEGRKLSAAELALNAKRVSAALSSIAVASTDLSLVLSRLYGSLLLENSSDALLNWANDGTGDPEDREAGNVAHGSGNVPSETAVVGDKSILASLGYAASPRYPVEDAISGGSPSDRYIAATIAESAVVASQVIAGQFAASEHGGSGTPVEADQGQSSGAADDEAAGCAPERDSAELEDGTTSNNGAEKAASDSSQSAASHDGLDVGGGGEVDDHDAAAS